MKSSWKLGKFAGIDVYLHATFILLLVWIASMHWMAGHSDAMRRDYRTIDASNPLEGVFMRIAESQEYATPVTEACWPVDLLTSDNLAEFFMLHTALEQSREHKQPQAA